MKKGYIVTLSAEYGYLGREYRPVYHTGSKKPGTWTEYVKVIIPDTYKPQFSFENGETIITVEFKELRGRWLLDEVLTTDKNGKPAITVPGRGNRKAYTLKSA